MSLPPMMFDLDKEKRIHIRRAPGPGGKCSPIIIPGRSGGATGIAADSDDLVLEASSPWNMPHSWERHPTFFLPGFKVVQLELTGQPTVDVTDRNWLLLFTRNGLNLFTASKGLDVCLYSAIDMTQCDNPNAITNSGHIPDGSVKLLVEGLMPPTWNYHAGDIITIRYHQP